MVWGRRRRHAQMQESESNKSCEREQQTKILSFNLSLALFSAPKPSLLGGKTGFFCVFNSGKAFVLPKGFTMKFELIGLGGPIAKQWIRWHMTSSTRAPPKKPWIPNKAKRRNTVSDSHSLSVQWCPSHSQTRTNNLPASHSSNPLHRFHTSPSSSSTWATTHPPHQIHLPSSPLPLPLSELIPTLPPNIHIPRQHIHQRPQTRPPRRTLHVRYNTHTSRVVPFNGFVEHLHDIGVMESPDDE